MQHALNISQFKEMSVIWNGIYFNDTAYGDMFLTVEQWAILQYCWINLSKTNASHLDQSIVFFDMTKWSAHV